MKSILISGITSLLLFTSCENKSHFTPVPTPNLWVDDYRPVSGMEHYKEWGTYNVHDPACKKFGDYYYMYSTDAIFAENKKDAKEKNVPLGYIQVRRSKDLVNWEFMGWAFPEIPAEAVEWVRSQNDGRGAGNIWAPYIIQYGDIYRLYYCVSAFGKKTSYLGLAESSSPEGPWELKGCVIKTDNESVMNAIDPSIIEDPENGKWWMHYGSYFGGLFCVELDPATGRPQTENDQGHLVARRANYRKDNLEAPEIIYHPGLKQYFLFVSYDPLMTTYNVRVGRSDKAEGPFFDFFGKEMRDTTNNFPILTVPYRFNNHPGWAGTAHCGVIEDSGRFFMFHQARLSPQNTQMILHTREVFFNSDGWPVVSPERYTASTPQKFIREDLPGEWEIMRIKEPVHERNLEAGQILWGEGELVDKEWNHSVLMTLEKNGQIKGCEDKSVNNPNSGNWEFNAKTQILTIRTENETIKELLIFKGHDWENEQETILFTGLDRNGRSVWGKRVK